MYVHTVIQVQIMWEGNTYALFHSIASEGCIFLKRVTINRIQSKQHSIFKFNEE